MSKGAGVDPDL